MIFRRLALLSVVINFVGCVAKVPPSADGSNNTEEVGCAGVSGGGAVEDVCGTCDADPSNDCQQDCAGEWGGEAVEDMCGTCDADPTNDCVADCSGDFGGEAVIDACGRCTGGETGLIACPTATLHAVEDAHIRSNAPDENYGTLEQVVVDRSTGAALVKFDLSSLPNDIVIRSLTLRATPSSNESFGGSGDVNVYFSSDDSWDQNSVTHATGPAFSDFILASWNVFEDPTEMDTVYNVIDDPELIESFQGQVWSDRTVTLYLQSPGYRSRYYATESADPSKHFAVDIAYQILSKVDLPVVADTYVDSGNAANNYGSEPSLVVDPRPRSSVDPPFTSFVKFDLSTIPADVAIERVSLQMHAFEGFAYGGDGNCYTYLVTDDSWDEMSITYDNQPDWLDDRIGSWWLWYDNEPDDKVGINASDLLVPPVQDAYTSDKLISFRLASPGYRTNYRSRETEDQSEHPRLTIYFTAN